MPDTPSPPGGAPVRAALHVSGVSVRFEATQALDGVDLLVETGEVRGLLGPNGAGKTTLLRSLLGLIVPDAGRIELLGRAFAPSPVPSLDGVAGFVEDPRFYPYLSARDNLEILALFDGRPAGPRIDAVLERVGLRSRAGDRVSGFSTGMRQRLGIAAALLREPTLLLLDEPTSGLDPAGARDLMAFLRLLADDGAAVLISSHQIGELEGICDTYTVIDHGRVVWDGTAEELRRQAPGGAFELVTTDDAVAQSIAADQPGVSTESTSEGTLQITAPQDAVDEIVIALGRKGIAVRRLERVTSPLESIFFDLMTARSADRDLTR